MLATLRNLTLSTAVLLAASLWPPLAQAGQTVAAAAVAADHPRLFDSREFHSPNMAQFKKWLDVLDRWQHERSEAMAPCPAGAWASCEPTEWGRLVGQLREAPLRVKIERVNSALNHHPYIPSERNWGQANYWATPFEFIRKSGQCQDYAIAKFMLLRALGVPNDQLRLVVVRDTERRLDHAIVVVYAEGEALVLDNQLDRVVPAWQVQRYRPYYSINETGWWLHLPNPIEQRQRDIRDAALW